MIKLRPHHLLCLIGWRGNGYNEAFSANFDKVAAALRGGGRFEAVMGTDDICAACPHNEEGECRRGPRARPLLLDQRVLERLELEAGQAYDYASVADALPARISPDDLASICAGCSWLDRGWCRTALAELKGAQ